MIWLAVIFVSPLYFALRKKWGAFGFNLTLYLLAVFTIIIGVGIVFWAIAVGHASWHLRKELMEEHATMIATKMAEKMREGKAV